jgi:hypothetical protein
MFRAPVQQVGQNHRSAEARQQLRCVCQAVQLLIAPAGPEIFRNRQGDRVWKSAQRTGQGGPDLSDSEPAVQAHPDPLAARCPLAAVRAFHASKPPTQNDSRVKGSSSGQFLVCRRAWIDALPVINDETKLSRVQRRIPGMTRSAARRNRYRQDYYYYIRRSKLSGDHSNHSFRLSTVGIW